LSDLLAMSLENAPPDMVKRMIAKLGQRGAVTALVDRIRTSPLGAVLPEESASRARQRHCRQLESRQAAGRSMNDPFTVLGVGEDAGDDQIKQRYLVLVARVSAGPRAGNVFQAYRAAYEAFARPAKTAGSETCCGPTMRPLSRLKGHFLAPSNPVSGRATKATVLCTAGRGDRSGMRASRPRFRKS